MKRIARAVAAGTLISLGASLSTLDGWVGWVGLILACLTGGIVITAWYHAAVRLQRARERMQLEREEYL